MPTSPRDLTDGKCRFLWENPPSCHRTSRADVGIGPYAVGETILSPTTAECFRGPLHTRPCGATLSKQERAGDACGRKRGGTRSDLVPPHTRHACGVPPSPRRGFVPSPVRAFGPATLSCLERVFQAIYASRSESFLTIREVMRNSTATKAKKPHWALVVSEVAMKS